MSRYRRWYQPGGTSFFTLVTYGRFGLFHDERARTLLGQVMREVSQEFPFKTVAIVLLPDHLHAIWSLPSGDADFSTRWKRIKSEFTKRWLLAGGAEVPVTQAQAGRGNRGVWQRRFIEHFIRDEEDLERHCDYIHYNPLKHGLVECLGIGPLVPSVGSWIAVIMNGIGADPSRCPSMVSTTACTSELR
jgi:putative transposase